MFDNLIGNEEIKNKLIKVLNNKNISHSYMFIGNKGIGKKEFAKEFAKGILCTNDINKICNECKSCIEFKNGNNPDYFEINLEQDENSIKIETIRKMQKKVQELPIISNRKVYIIDDSEYMTLEAQNCLLKTLEEPPKFVTIILIVSNENNILNTIKSRCLKMYFDNIENEDLKKYIDKNLDLNQFSTNMLEACQGSIGKAYEIYKNKDLYLEVDAIFNNIEDYTLTDVVSKLDILYKNKEHIQEILEYLNVIFIKRALKNDKYISYIECVEKIKRNMNLNCNYDMCIDSLIFEIWK